MKKITIIINGKAQVGKDTLCDFIIKNYNATKISSITPIIEIAKKYGWNGIKDKKSRKFLSDLKRTFIDFNNLPTNYLIQEHKEFLNSDKDILFVHIRESDQIESFVNLINDSCVCTTLLIRNKKTEKPVFFGNDSDDYVDNYPYEFRYNNICPLEEAEKNFLTFFEKMLAAKEITLNKRT